MSHNTLHDKMILRYAQIVAKEAATKEEQEELQLIEDQLHLTRESILKKATLIALKQIR